MIFMIEYTSEKVSNEYLELNSCGIEQLWDCDHSCIRENGRVDYHILYISQGICHAELKGRKVVLKEGDIILYPPNEKHKYSFYAKDKSISCYLHFSGTGCDELLSMCGFFPDLILNIGKSPIIEEIFKKMSTENIFRKTMYKKMTDIYLMEFFIELIRISEFGKKHHSKSKQEINNICRIMHEEYRNPRNVSQYAKMCHLSVSRFHHIFKECTDKSPIEYINDIRIKRAKELLSNTNLSMSEIAEISGFCNQNYFSRVFKKSVGISPKRFADLS